MPVTQATKTSLSRMRKPARNVGREATKPKPSSIKKDKVTPPTYEEQDQAQGSQDEGSEADVEDEAPTDAEVRPTQAPSRKQNASQKAQAGPSREKSSKRQSSKDVEVPTSTVANHRKMLALTSMHKSIATKGWSKSYFMPNLTMLGKINQAIASLIVNRKAVSDEHPTYNSVFSRTAIFFLANMQILRAREHSNDITDEQLKALKRFRAAIDFNKIMIPAPYIMLFQSLSVHAPSDRRFQEIVPHFPSVDHLRATQDRTHAYLSPARGVTGPLNLGFLPWMIGLCSMLMNVDDIGEQRKLKKTDDSDEKKMHLYFQGRYFVPFHRDRKNLNDFFGNKRDTAPSAGSSTDYFAQSAIFSVPFPDNVEHLKKVQSTIPPCNFPSHTSNYEVRSLMDYFMLGGNISWLSVILDSLTTEASFFEGSTTFEMIDVESGPEMTCQMKVTYDDNDTLSHEKWFATPVYEDDGVSISSGLADVTDEDLQIMYLNGTITNYDKPGTNYLMSLDSTKFDRDAPSTDKSPIFTKAGEKRTIKNVNVIYDQVALHIKGSMMKLFAEVL